MRDHIIRIRASADELAKIRELAKTRGLSISELIRRAAFGIRMPARSRDHTHVNLLTRSLGELGRVGGNLNQLVRRANAGKLSGHDPELSRTLAEIDALRERLRDIIR